jgi:type I restriction enzyme, S subunit
MKLRVDNRHLPSGWELKKFSEIAILSRGQNPPKSDFVHKAQEGYVRFYQIRDGHNDNYEVYVPDTPQIHKVDPDDILMVAYRHIGRVFRGATGAFNVALCKISNRNRSIIDDDYLFYIIPTEFVRGELMKQAERSLIPSMSVKHLAEIKIPVPPLSEQKRIVAIVDEAFEAIDIAINNTKQNLTNARELFESYLNAIFTQKNNVWVERKLGDTEIIQIIDGDRGTNYPQKSDFQMEGHCLFLNTKNVRPNGFNFDITMFITEEKDKLLRKGKLNRRDVLLTTRGTIGNIAVYDDSVEFDHIRINSGMLIFRPNEKFITSEYLFEVLRSSKMKSQIEKLTSGAAQPQLPIKTLVNFTFPVPTQIEEQHKIVLSLHELSEQTQRLEAIYQEKLAALTELKQSILQKAFTGELTADSVNQTPKKAKEIIAA